MHLGLRVKLKLTLGTNYMKNTQKISLWPLWLCRLPWPLLKPKSQSRVWYNFLSSKWSHSFYPTRALHGTEQANNHPNVSLLHVIYKENILSTTIVLSEWTVAEKFQVQICLFFLCAQARLRGLPVTTNLPPFSLFSTAVAAGFTA